MAAFDAASLRPCERRVHALLAWAEPVQCQLAMPPRPAHMSVRCTRDQDGPSPCDGGVCDVAAPRSHYASTALAVCRHGLSPCDVGVRCRRTPLTRALRHACAFSIGCGPARWLLMLPHHSTHVSVEFARCRHGSSPCDGGLRCRITPLTRTLRACAISIGWARAMASGVAAKLRPCEYPLRLLSACVEPTRWRLVVLPRSAHVSVWCTSLRCRLTPPM